MSGKPASKNSLLEIEDEITRQERLGMQAQRSNHPYLIKLALCSARLFAAQSSIPSSSNPVLPIERKTFPVPAPPDFLIVLSRLAAFLPMMKEANEALARKVSAEGPESVDIADVAEVSSTSEEGSENSDDEEISGGDAVSPPPPRKPYIQMNIGLGVFQQRPSTKVQPETKATAAAHGRDEDPSSSSSDDSSSESSEDSIPSEPSAKAL